MRTLLLWVQDTPEASWPPAALDLGNDIFESQQFAVAQPGACHLHGPVPA